MKIKNKNRILNQIEKELKVGNVTDSAYRVKLCIIRDVIKGLTITESCNKYGKSKATIYRYVDKINKNGMEGLKKKQGRNKKLTKAEEKNIEEIINNPANNYGYKTTLWTGQMLADLIMDEYSVNVTERYTQKLLKKYNYRSNNRDKHSVIKTSEELDDIVSTHNNVWYIVYFRVWKKKKEEIDKNKISVFTMKNVYYFMVLNDNENKIFLVEKENVFNVEDLYQSLVEFMEQFLLNYVKGKDNIIVMSNSPLNRRLIKDINQSKLDDFDFQIFSYKIETFKNNMIHEDFNPLNKLKLKITELIKEHYQDCKLSFNKKIRNKIKNIIEAEYDLY